LVAAERAWISRNDKDGALETVAYGDEKIENLQQYQNAVFRICERANTMERYLDLAKDRTGAVVIRPIIVPDSI